MFNAPPIFKTAVKFMFYDKAKSLGALFGVIISTFLIGQQAGVFNFVTNTMEALVAINSEYIWVIDHRTENANVLGKLDNRIEYEIKSFKGVKNVFPLFVGGATTQFPDGDNTIVTLVGVRPPNFVGTPKEFYAGNAQDLLSDGGVAIDIFDTRAFPVSDIGTPIEVNGRKAHIAANIAAVRNFGGILVFTTIERARLWTGMPSSKSSAFLVEPDPSANRAELIADINDNIFGVKAWEGKALGNQTIAFLLETTSIAKSIGTMVMFAFIAGFFIVGLTLFSAAVDRLKDYGTMKAIGATNNYIRKLIYTQAMIFAVVGFGIGFLLVEGFRIIMADNGLMITFSSTFLVIFFLMICSIALGGATFASRKVTKLEPAEVFRF